MVWQVLCSTQQNNMAGSPTVSPGVGALGVPGMPAGWPSCQTVDGQQPCGPCKDIKHIFNKFFELRYYHFYQKQKYKKLLPLKEWGNIFNLRMR